MAGPHVGTARAERSEVKKGGETHMLRNLLTMVRAREDGQSLAEYALILSLIAVAAIIALTALGGSINDILGQISAAL
jgi:Flp pilus assembly pilin Flp